MEVVCHRFSSPILYEKDFGDGGGSRNVYKAVIRPFAATITSKPVTVRGGRLFGVSCATRFPF
jgi:hypothetical protein